jgi:hypothetical protein
MAQTDSVTPPVVHADVGFLSLVTWLLVFAFAVLVGAAVTLRNYHFALGALLPAVLLVGIALDRSKSRRVEFGPKSLVCEQEGEETPYADICGLSVGVFPWLPEQAPRRGTVYVVTRTAVLELGGRIDVGRRELLRAVLDRIPRGGQIPEQSTLESFARAEREQFGNERVWTFRAVERCRKRSGVAFVGWGLLIVGVVWVVAAVTADALWSVGAGMVALFALLAGARALGVKSRQNIVGKNWRNSGLVISPTAVAMVQGDLKGKARWSEVRSVTFKRNQLVIEVAGATIPIPDIYDRPIQQIVELIRLYSDAGYAVTDASLTR